MYKKNDNRVPKRYNNDYLLLPLPLDIVLFFMAIPTAVELCAIVLEFFVVLVAKSKNLQKKSNSAKRAARDPASGTFDFSSSMYFTIH